MTNVMKDFISPPRKTSVMIRGIGGAPQASCVGTALWKVKDDDGTVHSWVIPNTVCNPHVPCRLLSSQHWAQERNEEPNEAMGCRTHSNTVKLFGTRQDSLETSHSTHRPIAAPMRSVSDFLLFHLLCEDMAGAEDVPQEQELMTMANVVLEGEEDSSEDCESDDNDVSLSDVLPNDIQRHPGPLNEVFDWTTQSFEFCHPMNCEAELQSEGPHRIPEDVETQCATPAAELLSWHCQ